MKFNEKVYDLLRKVPAGKVTTYKELAHAMNTKAYQAIGQAMRNNPYAPEVPCHRVVKSDGRIGGFNGMKSGEEISKKESLLQKEGIIVRKGRIMGFEDVFLRF